MMNTPRDESGAKLQRNLLALALALLALGLGGWFVWRSSPAPAPKIESASEHTNVVMVIGCTLRKDQLSPYGGDPRATPYLQEFAKRGTLFADAIAAAPWTRAASTALLTGKHALSIGMVEPGPQGNKLALADEITTLAERLKSKGYSTLGLTANPNLRTEFGFSQGFDHYWEATQRLRKKGGANKSRGVEVVNEALKLIDQTPSNTPVYLQLMLVDAHRPYILNMIEELPFLTANLPRALSRYRAALLKFDDALRYLHEQLATRGFTENNTLFIVVNDHGEGLRYPLHHGWSHGYYTFLSSVGMTWIMSGVGVARGHVVKGIASQVDLVPTLNSMLGIEGYQGPGQDWSEQVRGTSARTTRELAFVDTWFREAIRGAVYSEETSCHDDFGSHPRTRGVKSGAIRPELPYPACYDRKNDPDQTRPLPSTNLIQRLYAWRNAQLKAGESFAHTQNVEIDEDIAEQLKALGYAE